MIEVANVSFAYPGSHSSMLDNISFTIERGKILGFLGPSGSGKSTTQKLLIKLLSGYKGTIELLNKPLGKWGNDLYNNIGVCFELPNHYSKLTALENLRFFTTFFSVPTMNPLKLLEMVGLKDDANKRVGSFSKGMKNRLNFARALLNDPPLLFLDEPTSGLDPINARKVKDIINNLRENGKTIFITTHNMADADELCDHVAFLSGGKIAVCDSPKALKSRYGKSTVEVEWRENGLLQKDSYAMEGLAENNKFLEVLKTRELCSIHSDEATLESVFIKVTGKAL